MVIWVGWDDTGCCCEGTSLGRNDGEGQALIFPPTGAAVLELRILLTS